MIIVVEGTKAFEDYSTFTRAMSVAMSSFDKENDNSIQVWSAGPANINSYTAAFCNLTENYLKQKGVKLRFTKVPYTYVEENFQYVDYFAFFSADNERWSRLASKADAADVRMEVYKY